MLNYYVQILILIQLILQIVIIDILYIMQFGENLVEEKEKKWRDEYEEEQRWKCEAVRGSTAEEFSNTGTEEDY